MRRRLSVNSGRLGAGVGAARRRRGDRGRRGRCVGRHRGPPDIRGPDLLRAAGDEGIEFSEGGGAGLGGRIGGEAGPLRNQGADDLDEAALGLRSVARVNLYGGIVKTTVVASAFIKAYDDKLIDLPVYARLKGSEAEKAKEMLNGTRTKMFNSVEEAINASVMGVKN